MAAATTDAPALTGKQRAVLEYLCATLAAEGYQPGLADVAAALGLGGKTSPLCHLAALARKGYLGPPDGRARALRILRLPDGRPFKGLAFVE